MRLTETGRVPTGKRRPPIACRNTNWQLVLGQAKLPSYKSLRRFIRLEVALLSASVESSAISLLEVLHYCDSAQPDFAQESPALIPEPDESA